ncbi:hypothetical protein [Sphingomonas koreensis]|uniref:hypothetical protein n=1 Tax=Sphingomonas koreensis TaxID=93064 RepID=UPI000F7E772C|nr:hypothetical protein [Sphingomonas koreensis]RSU24211.1 hypothetical protein CA224_00235 [Sphingomonas koreensis]RSX68403.1 hypothetical protein DAH88_04795 [Sphingomonas koreensis]
MPHRAANEIPRDGTTMYKGNNSFRSTMAALICTLVVSTTCLASVVGPAATATADVSTQATA